MTKLIMSLLRKKVFFLLDFLSGGTVKKAYLNLSKIEALDSNSPEIKSYQEDTIKNLLSHAAATTEFYSEYPTNKLSDFPVINKEIIRSQQDRFISDRYEKESLIKMFTSGSTGTPFCSYQDKIKKKHVIAELLYYSKKAGYDLGKNLIYIRGISEDNVRPRFKQWLHNQRLILISKLDDNSIEDIIREMNLGYESTVLGYGSTYNTMKSYFQRNGYSLPMKDRVRGIISNGEMLFDDSRESVEKAFNCRCYSRYSNQENGIIGQDDEENNTFLINEGHYFVEILKMDSDEPAEPEEVGRIVLTDLYNYAMPMIRYDTGDIGSFKYIQKGSIRKKAITDFGGRRGDLLFTAKGELLSSSVIQISFGNFPDIKQFQFIQEGPGSYLVRVNTSNEFHEKERLFSSLKNFLGEEAHIELEVVDEIPILASGKRKVVINKML